ncbi:hypothetical protein D8M23_06720 [Rothia sp. HSID18067]|uniref:hypothetical protein n=1 Tax=Rothia TaxID=32207 RepID=UPI000F861F6B|nr:MULTISPECIES: hypothetical protein [Rothia]RUP72398.1 hypothetical protein D8M23_06720 [Rothia sp. HSID18067]
MFHSPQQEGIRYQKMAKSAGARGQKNDETYLMVKKPHAPHHRGRISQENRDYRPRYGTSTAVTAYTMYLESVK